MKTSMDKTIRAIQFIEDKHYGQRRKFSGLPYIVHLFNVYAIAKEYKHSTHQDDISAICLLHDTLEDTDTTVEELTFEFGPLVANTVAELTNDRAKIAQIGKTKYVDEKLLTLSNYALVVKLADMLANIIDHPQFSTLQRISHHIEFLKAHRKLTPSQQKITNHIEEYLCKI